MAARTATSLPHECSTGVPACIFTAVRIDTTARHDAPRLAAAHIKNPAGK
ncbi:hypothetical protein [Burkholderia arboris]